MYYNGRAENRGNSLLTSPLECRSESLITWGGLLKGRRGYYHKLNGRRLQAHRKARPIQDQREDLLHACPGPGYRYASYSWGTAGLAIIAESAAAVQRQHEGTPTVDGAATVRSVW